MANFVSIEIEGIEELANKLRSCAVQSQQKDKGGYTVGYAAPYAIYVHENVSAQHVHGQAKFLEQPTMDMHGELAHSIRLDVEHDLGLKIANENAAIKLLQASQELVPVDTGALKDSGYVRDEHEKTVYGSDQTPDEILAWQKLLKSQQRLQQQIQQGHNPG